MLIAVRARSDHRVPHTAPTAKSPWALLLATSPMRRHVWGSLSEKCDRDGRADSARW